MLVQSDVTAIVDTSAIPGGGVWPTVSVRVMAAGDRRRRGVNAKGIRRTGGK